MTKTPIQASQTDPDLPARSREEKSRQVAMEAKFLGPANMADKKGKTKQKKTVMYDFNVHDYSQGQNSSPYLSFDNTNGHLCQDGLSRSRNLPTMVT